jgi:4-diphosphocytidyl-2-C-methyl-D-erythritol kinase
MTAIWAISERVKAPKGGVCLTRQAFLWKMTGMSHAQQAHISSNSDFCFVQAYAKINLTLDVLGRRSDGYHELVTVMQTIDLHDTICLTATDDEQVEVICTQPDLGNDENLAARAARLLCQHIGHPRGVRIELNKRIPTAAGLGGGSSDAAAVLLGLEQWWHLRLPFAELQSLAATLGSDVPFFLTGGLACCEGRGERVVPLNPHWPSQMRWLLLLKPAISVSTGAVFRDLPASDYTDGSCSRSVCEALNANRSPEPEQLFNALERSVLVRYPQVAQARAALLNAGAQLVRLSGSGPTLYAPFADLACATQVQQQMQAQGYEAYLSRVIHPNASNISLC